MENGFDYQRKRDGVSRSAKADERPCGEANPVGLTFSHPF